MPDIITNDLPLTRFRLEVTLVFGMIARGDRFEKFTTPLSRKTVEYTDIFGNLNPELFKPIK